MLYQLSYTRVSHRARPTDYLRPAVSGGGRIRTYEDVRRQIYSLLPLTARQPLRDRVPPGAAERA